jgi:prepilin-type processing-associated H-X9-DG protein
LTILSSASPITAIGMSCYVGNGGTDDPSISNPYPSPPKRNGMFEDSLRVSFKDIADGTSNTWLVLERFHNDPGFDSYSNGAPGQSIDSWGYWIGGTTYDSWIYPTVGVNDQMPSGLIDPQCTAEWIKRLDSMGSGHPSGANAALADGSVWFVSNSMSVAVITAAATRSGGEVLGSDW